MNEVAAAIISRSCDEDNGERRDLYWHQGALVPLIKLLYSKSSKVLLIYHFAYKLFISYATNQLNNLFNNKQWTNDIFLIKTQEAGLEAVAALTCDVSHICSELVTREEGLHLETIIRFVKDTRPRMRLAAIAVYVFFILFFLFLSLLFICYSLILLFVNMFSLVISSNEECHSN